MTNLRSRPTGWTRRTVLKNLSVAAGAAAGLSPIRSRAAEPPRLDVKDPAAIALAYVENVSQIDAKNHPEYAIGSNCDNCLLLEGTPGNNYRPCSLFPGKLVSASGWCKGWTAEM